MHTTQIDTIDAEEENMVEAEKERQLKLLHKNVDGLKVNLAKVEILAAVKVKNHLNDNEHLLQEVNDMRHEVSEELVYSVCSILLA